MSPKQTGFRGKVNLHGISKCGDTHLYSCRSTAREACLPRAGSDPWIEQMKKRRPLNVMVVALATNIARTIWAVLAHDRQHEKG